MLNHVALGAAVLAAEGGLSDLETAFQTAITSVQTDVMGFVKIALPVGLGIMGVFLAIRLGIRFFRSIAN